MLFTFLRCLCFVTLLTHNPATCTTVNDDDDPRRTFPFRRAIDGSRGRKFYDADNDDFEYSHGSSGRYDPDHHANDFSDIRNNVPGEPGVDYPSYTRLPQTGFVCQADFRGYYADEIAGCQVFHVCDGTFLVSSFLCPVGSVFSQKLLTCDWWTKVDCSTTQNYYVTNVETHVSEVDDDEILRKAFEMSSVKSSGERIPIETLSNQQRESDQRRRISNYDVSTSTGSTPNSDPEIDSENYPDYDDLSSGVKPRFRPTSGSKIRQRYREDYYYNGDNVDVDEVGSHVSPIKVHTIGNDRNNDRSSFNEFVPSYAPTVPTVITTTRRYYSPTFPTTYRPTTENARIAGRYDLEVESSDHLYTAKGRKIATARNAVTPASVFTRLTTNSKNFDLARFVNNAGENNENSESMQQSESTNYGTNITHPIFRTNNAKNRTLVDFGILRNPEVNDGKIVEKFEILTIDDENSNSDKFVYNREGETIFTNETKVDVIFKLDEKNSTGYFGSEENEGDIKKIAVFLEPPREDVKQFRITVLEDSSTPEVLPRNYKSDGSINNHSDANVQSIVSVEVPNSTISPPLSDVEDNARQSRLIRIFANNDNSRNEFLQSIDVDSAITKINSNDSISSIDGSHKANSYIEKTPEDPPEEGRLTNATRENENLTIDSETSSSAKKNSSDAAVSKSLENFYSLDVVNASVNLEESELNGTAEASPESRSSIDQQIKIDDDEKSEEIFPASKISLTNEKTSTIEGEISDKTLFTQEKIVDYTIGSEAILLNAKTAVSNEKSSDDHAPDEKISTYEKTTNFEKKNKKTIRKNDGDSFVEESSPLEVTLTLNNDEEFDPDSEVIRELIGKQEIGDSIIARGYKSFEIVKSDALKTSRNDPEDFSRITDSRIGRKIESPVHEQRINNFPSNDLKSANELRSLISLVNGPNPSRPFALDPSRIHEIANPSFIDPTRPSTTISFIRENGGNDFVPIDDRITDSTIRQTTNDSSSRTSENPEESSPSSEIESISGEDATKQSKMNFNEAEQQENEENLIFVLPHPQRALDFESGRPLITSEEEIEDRIDDNEEIEESRTTPKSVEKMFAKTVVETEFVPSISFSLNTDGEREEYMEAVIKGLLPDIRATQSTNNDTNTSVES